MRVIKNAEPGALSVGQPPVEKAVQFVRCDRDQACDYAKFEVITPSGPVYLCGHHFHVNELFLLSTKYEVKRINEA